MPNPKKSKPKNSALEKNISDILVANNYDLRPYIEILHHIPKNILERPMGNLLGIFEVKDDDENSAYIVNFLSSVIRKEYFSIPKRDPAESFESALNKANLALSELAKHENISWVGKLDAAICAIDENTLHFSTTGGASVLLARENVLTDISQGMSPSKEELSPLKTFTNISSGKIQSGDKIIVTTEDIFHILSWKEIEKKSFTLSTENFSRFLKTALVNELDIGATIIIDAKEKKVEAKKKKRPVQKEINAFSQKDFEEKISWQRHKEEEMAENSETKEEFVDKKTGHIYLRGKEYVPSERNFLIEQKDAALEYLKEIIRCALKEIRLKIQKIIRETQNKLTADKPAPAEKKDSKFQTADIPQRITRVIKWKRIYEFARKKINALKIKSPKTRSIHSRIKPAMSDLNLKSLSVKLREKQVFKIILPSFSRIKNLFFRLTYPQKMYALFILILIFSLPIALFKMRTPAHKNLEIGQNEGADIIQDNAGETSVATMIFFSPEIIGSFLSPENTWIVTKNEVIEASQSERKKEFILPNDWGNAEKFAFMDDLNLVFILTDKHKVASFSPLNKKFFENNIEIPAEAEISQIGTYLTYLYLLDETNNQIYRYPRAEGGFGTRTDWLKEMIELENIASMAINGNVYLTDRDGNLLKFFQGKKNELKIKNASEEQRYDSVFANEDEENIYLLNKKEGRIIQSNPSGEIISEFENEALKNAKNFIVADGFETIYITTDTGQALSLQTLK